jgi:hypothetical protein
MRYHSYLNINFKPKYMTKTGNYNNVCKINLENFKIKNSNSIKIQDNFHLVSSNENYFFTSSEDILKIYSLDIKFKNTILSNDI